MDAISKAEFDKEMDHRKAEALDWWFTEGVNKYTLRQLDGGEWAMTTLGYPRQSWKFGGYLEAIEKTRER